MKRNIIFHNLSLKGVEIAGFVAQDDVKHGENVYGLPTADINELLHTKEIPLFIIDIENSFSAEKILTKHGLVKHRDYRLGF